MHYTRQRPSFILTVTLLTIAALFLTACGTMPQDAAVQDRDPVGIAIAQAESASGFTFAREAVNERVMEGSVATAYVSSRDEALLTVIVSDSQPAELYSWSVVYFEGAEQVVLSMTGEEQRTPVERVLDDEDSVHTLDRCVYCARTVTHPPEWVENWVTRTVKRAISAANATACKKKGGTWLQLACYLISEEWFDDGYWTKEWTECVEWRPFPEGICIED